jgi:hypothetical protein
MVESRLVVFQPFQHYSANVRIARETGWMYDVVQTVVEDRNASHDEYMSIWAWEIAARIAM